MSVCLSAAPSIARTRAWLGGIVGKAPWLCAAGRISSRCMGCVAMLATWNISESLFVLLLCLVVDVARLDIYSDNTNVIFIACLVTIYTLFLATCLFTSMFVFTRFPYNSAGWLILTGGVCNSCATVPGAISLVLQTVNYCRRVKYLCPLSVWWVCRLRTSVLVKLVDRMVFWIVIVHWVENSRVYIN